MRRPGERGHTFGHQVHSRVGDQLLGYRRGGNWGLVLLLLVVVEAVGMACTPALWLGRGVGSSIQSW